MRDSEIDRWLASQYGTFSIKELAEQTGVPEPDIVQRVTAYYDSIRLTQAEIRAKSVMQLQEIANESMERARNSSARDSSGNWNSSLAAVKALMKEVSDAEKRESGDDQKELYGRVLAGIVQRAMDRAIGVLSERHPEIDATELEKELQLQVLSIASEMDSE